MENNLKVNLKDRAIWKMKKDKFVNEEGVDLIIKLWNGGATAKEIAEKTGKTIQFVNMILTMKKLFG